MSSKLIGWRRNGQPIYQCRGGSDDGGSQAGGNDDGGSQAGGTGTGGGGGQEDAAELAELRREKAEREKAARDAEQAELRELRGYKQAQESRNATKVKAPTPKVDKPPTTVQPSEGPKKPRGRGGASRLWFGAEDDD